MRVFFLAMDTKFLLHYFLEEFFGVREKVGEGDVYQDNRDSGKREVENSAGNIKKNGDHDGQAGYCRNNFVSGGNEFRYYAGSKTNYQGNGNPDYTKHF